MLPVLFQMPLQEGLTPMKHLAFFLTLCVPLPAIATPVAGGPVSPDGQVKVMIDYPEKYRAKNVGGRDGAGLCVFTSIMHSARWQLEPSLYDFQDKMRQEAGGGWPGKVDMMIPKYGQGVDYLQYEGRDMTVLAVALRSGRLPSVTYSGRDPHYRGSIAHMVNLVHLDAEWACILDNNFIGANDLVWMTPTEFFDRWSGKGSGWAVVLLKAPPQPFISRLRLTTEPPQVYGSQSGDGWIYYWYFHATDPRCLYLYCRNNTWNKSPVGAYYLKEKYFRYYDQEHDEWLLPAETPFPPPKVPHDAKTGNVGDDIQDFGVPLHMFPPRQKDEDRWTRKGLPADKNTLLSLMPPLPPPQPDNPQPGPNSPVEHDIPAVIFAGSMLLLAFFSLLPKRI
jgi:hypothetical protein